jgi:hypothetical protein
MAAISPKPNSISTIIRSYKSAVTKYGRPVSTITSLAMHAPFNRFPDTSSTIRKNGRTMNFSVRNDGVHYLS